jgi:hypothetical protein
MNAGWPSLWGRLRCVCAARGRAGLQISGEPTEASTNPRVEMLPSLEVKITTRPVKPTCNDCEAPPSPCSLATVTLVTIDYMDF